MLIHLRPYGPLQHAPGHIKREIITALKPVLSTTVRPTSCESINVKVRHRSPFNLTKPLAFFSITGRVMLQLACLFGLPFKKTNA